jgi:hypothetical protein
MKAFEIDPVIKPDMSNYLIHMTDKDSFHSILESGENVVVQWLS